VLNGRGRLEAFQSGLRAHGFKTKDTLPPSGSIPANLLGNIWSQEWTNIADVPEPFALNPRS
jgi:Angiotensin-converting enzyme